MKPGLLICLHEARVKALANLNKPKPTGPLAPGDLFSLDLSMMDWLFLRENPDDPNLWAIIPVDDWFPWIGTPDVTVGQWNVRCGQGMWIHRSLLSSDLRHDRMPQEALQAVKRKMIELVFGTGLVSQPTVDCDPEYESFIEGIEEEGRELEQRNEREKLFRP